MSRYTIDVTNEFKRDLKRCKKREKVGSTKSYISRIEKGLIEPGAGFFLRIMSALNLQMQFVTKDGFIPV